MQQERPGEENPLFRLLAFLARDQPQQDLPREQLLEQRGRLYNDVKEKLSRLFAYRGSPTPEELAAETLDRAQEVLSKKPAGWEKKEYEGDPVHWVVGFVRYIFLESLRDASKQDSLENKLKHFAPSGGRPVEAERRDACLRQCIQQLPNSEDQHLILAFHAYEKRTKIEHHRVLAKQFNLSANALRIRCCRIRQKLRPCLEECLKIALQAETI